MSKTVKEEFGDLGKQAGKRMGKKVSRSAENKAEEMGQRLGKAFGGQVDRAQKAIQAESVTNEEQLGIGGKIGTGIGVVGKRLVEKKYGFLSKFLVTGDLVSEGRATGAKAEKILKRVVKRQMGKLAENQKKKDGS